MEEEPGWKFEDAAEGGSLRARYSLQRKEIKEEKWGKSFQGDRGKKPVVNVASEHTTSTSSGKKWR